MRKEGRKEGKEEGERGRKLGQEGGIKEETKGWNGYNRQTETDLGF